MAQQKDRASSNRRLLSSSRGPGDGESAKVVLKMLARRLKEVAGYQISSASLAAGLKTLSVWHRCINSGDDTFVTLCARYPHLVESPPTNPAGQLYAAYLRELLATFAVCKHAYHRETTFDEPRMRRISEEMVVEESQLIECQLRRLVACDMQGGLIDHKTRNSTQYCINLLILDAIGLFKALDGAVERLREMVSSLAKSDADKMVRLFGNYEKLVDKLTALAGQADFRPDVTVPLTAFDEASVEDFKRKIASAKVSARATSCCLCYLALIWSCATGAIADRQRFICGVQDSCRSGESRHCVRWHTGSHNNNGGTLPTVYSA